MSCTTKYFPDFHLTSSGNYSKVYKDCDQFFLRLPRKGILLKQVQTRTMEIIKSRIFQSGEVKVAMRLYKKIETNSLAGPFVKEQGAMALSQRLVDLG